MREVINDICQCGERAVFAVIVISLVCDDKGDPMFSLSRPFCPKCFATICPALEIDVEHVECVIPTS